MASATPWTPCLLITSPHNPPSATASLSQRHTSQPCRKLTKRIPARLRAGEQVSVWNDTKGGCKLVMDLSMPGVGLSKSLNRKAPSERSALKPYWGSVPRMCVEVTRNAVFEMVVAYIPHF